MARKKRKMSKNKKTLTSKINKIIKANKRLLELLEVFKNKLDQLDEGHIITLFLGNGISGNELKARNIILDFWEEIRNEDPRAFKKYSSIFYRFLNSLQNIDVGTKERQTYSLINFMSDFSGIEELRSRFIGFMIGRCCCSDINLNHYYVLLLIYLISFFKDKNFKVITFTVNYDSLMEKAYFGLKSMMQGKKEFGTSDKRLPLNKPDLYKGGPKKGIFLDERDILNKESALNKPKYVLSRKMVNLQKIPIIPIHGSIRICKCARCNRVLDTEATGINKKICTRCGGTIPQIILPMKEGFSDRKVLNLFENTIKMSNLIIFVGFNFDDPHIEYKLKQGIKKYSDKVKFPQEKLIINLLDKKIPSAIKLDLSKNAKLFELNGNLQRGLLTLILSFNESLIVDKFDFEQEVLLEDYLLGGEEEVEDE